MTKEILIKIGMWVIDSPYGLHAAIVLTIVFGLIFFTFFTGLLRLNKGYREWDDLRRERRKKKREERKKEEELKKDKESINDEEVEEKEKEDFIPLLDFLRVRNIYSWGFIIIVFTIFFLGSIEQKYNLPDFEPKINQSMENLGSQVSDTFRIAFTGMYRIGKGENSIYFYWMYWLVIIIILYNIFRSKFLLVYKIYKKMKGGDKQDGINKLIDNNRSYSRFGIRR